MPRMDSMMRTRTIVLQALLNMRKASGSEIIESVKEKTKGAIVPNGGDVYPVLSRLAEEGLAKECTVKDESRRNQAGGRPKKFFRLTAKGKKLATKQFYTLQDVLSW